MIEEDALQARLIAVRCWDAETSRGPEWQALPSNDGINLPRGLAHQGRYALHLLAEFDGDLDRLMATAVYCRRAAQEQDRERQARWMRAADLCEQAVARVTNHAGADLELQRAVVHRLLNPEPEPELKESLVYRTVWVARLPNPHHLSKAPCLRVLTNAERWARQLRPTRTARACCRYHGGDWHQASHAARRVLRQAGRQARSNEDIYLRSEELLERTVSSEWVREAALSLLDPADGIVVAQHGGHDEWFLHGGQHRTQALLDAGVRRTVVLVER